MRKIIPGLPCLVWGVVGVILETRGAAMPEGLFYGGLLIAVMVGVMLGVMCHD